MTASSVQEPDGPAISRSRFWLVLLPFRLVGVAVEGVLALIWAILTLPLRLSRAPGRR